MLLTLTLPRINASMTTAIIRTLHAAEGEALAPGAKFLDLSIDLSASIPHDCPPISYYLIALRDRVWLRRLAIAPGDEIAVGVPIAQFSTERDESLEGAPARAVRVSIAGIVYQSDFWQSDFWANPPR